MIRVTERKYINLLLSFGIILIIVLLSLAFSQINKLYSVNNLVIHSHEVMAESDKILININFVESRVRAYVITGKKEYISTLDAVFAQLRGHLTRLKNLTQDNPSLQVLIIKLINDTNWRINDIKYKIKIYQDSGVKKLLSLPITGVLVSDKIRETIRDINLSESNLLKIRDKEAKEKYLLINTLISVCGFFSLLFLFIGLYLLNRQIRYRSLAEYELKKSENELYKLAYHDSLTGLANRTLIHKNIDEFLSLSNTENIALLFIDLDNFKNINDSLGHEVGDSLLKAYAERLTDTIRNNDIAARLGGDEFIVLLKNIKNQDDVWNIAKDIQYSVTAHFEIKTHKIFVTSSIGVSMYPGNGKTAHELLKNADIAMYKAKELGKNNIQFCVPSLIQHAEECALIDFELHRALANKEFYLVYQPIISLKDNSIVSVEVLIRWQRPNIGVVYPGNFIKLAENNGLIMPIGDWMLRLACVEAKKWIVNNKNGKPIKIAVNVSTRQFILSDFAADVSKILNDTGFDPSLLELEITESVLFENTYSNLATLNTLKDMGIKISIDDFGTGYSSLNYLRTFAIDKLKIDRSFINEVGPDNDTTRIIKSIINMAHDLNITVLAEGIETKEQMEFLKKNRCDEAQGYYYSYPLTAREFSIFLEKRETIKA